MNNRLPEYFLEKPQLIGTVTFAVLFAIVFLNIYIPFSDTAWFRLGNSVFFLFTAGFIAVSVLILAASRILMYFSRKWFRMTYLVYILWCFAEVILICLFYTFVTIDVQHPSVPPARIFSKALFYGVICLITPYTLSGMYYAILDKNRTIRLMSSQGFASDQEPFKGKESQITLFDYAGALKFSVKSSNLYYIEADDNYIKAWYTDSRGVLKKYILRSRLKTIEESFKGTSLIRCNRKYIVNVDKIKVLRKEDDGYVIDLDNEEVPPIAVTKTYVQNVLSRFSPQPGAQDEGKGPSA